MCPAFWVRKLPALEFLFKVFAEDQRKFVSDFVRGDETRNCQEEAKCLFDKMVFFWRGGSHSEDASIKFSSRRMPKVVTD